MLYSVMTCFRQWYDFLSLHIFQQHLILIFFHIRIHHILVELIFFTISITFRKFEYSFFYQSDGLIWHSLDMFRNYVLYELCIVCGYLRSSPSNLYFVIGTLLIITLNRYTNWQEKILMTWRWSLRMQIKCIS